MGSEAAEAGRYFVPLGCVGRAAMSGQTDEASRVLQACVPGRRCGWQVRLSRQQEFFRVFFAWSSTHEAFRNLGSDKEERKKRSGWRESEEKMRAAVRFNTRGWKEKWKGRVGAVGIPGICRHDADTS
jgi:hypothetical protein